MCRWCEVEQRAYRSCQERERQALEDLRRLREECPGETVGERDCPDRPRCLWERKLDFVIARIRKERLAAEMAASRPCDPEEAGASRGRPARKPPSPTLSPHFLRAFETYIETVFDRISREGKPSPTPRRRSRKPLPFGRRGGVAR